MDTVQVTPDIRMLRFPVGQAYLIGLPGGFALVDSGPAGSEQDILAALAAAGGAPGDLREIVLTHAHSDHTGSAAALAAATGARVAAGAADADAVRGSAQVPPPVLEQDWERALYERITPGVTQAPPAPVHRELADGDRLDWGLAARVLHVPGHTAGSVAVHLPELGVLFTGDTVAMGEGRPIPGVFSNDHVALAAAYARLAALDTATVLFGHGEPLTADGGAVLRAAAP
ncbi:MULTISPECIES: MBL fold metallo-hydrolase [unclassified Streptomyces]|uniref:MBL fold metallo-hydrolase n=1 Tax=unclassified Streptomyces TaxID=2593676 RepID=UPI000B8666C1|nr:MULTISPECIES: MBL fold metallo-hydrolase [unclassified Streptomyces]MYS23331.1 MBL fold metallo-hydrolase [Streptomyces sp. SID4948]